MDSSRRTGGGGVAIFRQTKQTNPVPSEVQNPAAARQEMPMGRGTPQKSENNRKEKPF
jgi:hypothetical protein